MRTIHETIYTLEEFNKWRRGNKTTSAPEPFELGVAIGDAVRLLRELFVMQVRAEKAESELAAAKKDLVIAHDGLDERDRLRALSDQLSNNLSAVGAAYNAEKARAEKAEGNVEQLTKHCFALEVEVAVLSEGLSEDHAIYIANARAEKAEAELHDLNLDLSTANHMIKLERDRADALQTRLNEIDAMLKSPDLID